MPDLHKGLIDAINSGNDIEAKQMISIMSQDHSSFLSLGEVYIAAAKNGNLEILSWLETLWDESLDRLFKKRKEEDNTDSNDVMDYELKHTMQARLDYLAEACDEATSNNHYDAKDYLINECGA
jgi:hypothetical protein